MEFQGKAGAGKDVKVGCSLYLSKRKFITDGYCQF